MRTDGSFRISLPFLRTSWGVGVLNSAILLTVFKIGLNLAQFWRVFGISEGGGVLNTPLGTPLRRGIILYGLRYQSISWGVTDDDNEENGGKYTQICPLQILFPCLLLLSKRAYTRTVTAMRNMSYVTSYLTKQYKNKCAVRCRQSFSVFQCSVTLGGDYNNYTSQLSICLNSCR